MTPALPDCDFQHSVVSSVVDTTNELQLCSSPASSTPTKSPDSPTSFTQWLLSQDDDDDDGSVQSVAYFEPTDFQAAFWTEALDLSTATWGVAVLGGLAVAVTHPVIFLAGLAGLATASASVDFCWGSTTTQEEEITQKTSTATESTAPLVQPDCLACASTMATVVPDDFLSEQWLKLHYTDLPRTVLRNQEFVGLSVPDFFGVFFDDAAPYSFRQFQQKRGDLGIRYGTWQTTPVPSCLSLAPPTDAPTDWHNYSQTRELNYKAKTSNALVGPPYATTRKVQRYSVFGKRMGILEHRTTVSDIPFAGTFCVLERWILRATKDTKGLYTTRVSIQTGVQFNAYCPWEGAIRQKSGAAVTDVVHAWCRMAAQAMQLTDKAKRIRAATADEAAIEMNVDDYESQVAMTPVLDPVWESSRKRSGRFQGIRRSLSNVLLGRA